MYKLLLPVVACLALGACATVPTPLTGQFSQVPLQNAAANDGSQVRWGGQIIDTVPGKNHTCIYALSRPLDSQARPQQDKDSMGRFVACRDGFYDPEIFAKGREITVTGTIDGSLTRKVGKYDYAYPRVQADTVYLWPRKTQHTGYPYYPYGYSPFWGPAYGNPFWGRGWYRPSPIIVVRPDHSSTSSGD